MTQLTQFRIYEMSLIKRLKWTAYLSVSVAVLCRAALLVLDGVCIIHSDKETVVHTIVLCKGL